MAYKYTLAFKHEENLFVPAIRHTRVFLSSPERNRENVIRTEVAQLRGILPILKNDYWAFFKQLTEMMITRKNLVKIKEKLETVKQQKEKLERLEELKGLEDLKREEENLKGQEENLERQEEKLEENLKRNEHAMLFFEFCERYRVEKTEQEDLLKILLSKDDYIIHDY